MQKVILNLMWMRVTVLECNGAYQKILCDWTCNSEELHARATMALGSVWPAFNIYLPKLKGFAV